MSTGEQAAQSRSHQKTNQPSLAPFHNPREQLAVVLVDRSSFVNCTTARGSALIVTTNIPGNRITSLTNYAIETAASRIDGAHT